MVLVLYISSDDDSYLHKNFCGSISKGFRVIDRVSTRVVANVDGWMDR